MWTGFIVIKSPNKMNSRLIGALHFAVLLLGLSPDFSLAQSLSGRDVIRTPAGPWGVMEYYRVPLEAPEEYLRLLSVPSQRAEWDFPVGGEPTVRSSMLEGGLDPAEIDRIVKGSSIIKSLENTRVFPTDETVLSLPHASRMLLYHLLSTFPGNRFQARPVYIDSENLSAWFAGSGMPRAAIEDVSILAYRTPKDHGFFFSDIPLLLRRTLSSSDEKTILKGIYRRQGLMVRLRFDRESMSESLVNYWSASYKYKAVFPILRSILEAREDGAIDIAHLLPATARQSLNRFPDPGDGISGRYPDWFWTCYNFFRFVPKNVYADSPEMTELLASEFQPSLPPLQFGDMILITSGAKIIHGCIHIADDLVYTKNGADVFSPWVIMKLPDVVAYHDLSGDSTLSVYRHLDIQSENVP